MRRGDIVLATAPGDSGKRQPAVVIQANLLNDSHASVILCLFTGTLVDAPLFRLTVAPTAGNGLKEVSQIMVDKVMTLRRDRIGEPIGVLDDDTVLRLSRSLAFVIGLAS